MIKPMNSGSRISGMAVENSVMQMQYTAKHAIKTLMIMDKMHLSFFFLYDNYGREALP